MIDLHCHLLPGIDDGSPSMAGSIAMARAAVDSGVEAIVATPHVNRRYPNDPAALAPRCAELQHALDDAGVAVHAVRPVLDKAVAELPELEHALGWLSIEVPRAILAGDEVHGSPPMIEPRRGMLGRLRRG